MAFKLFPLLFIGFLSVALSACSQPGPAGPAGRSGPEGPVGPRGPQGVAGKDAPGAPGTAKTAAAFLRRPAAETEGKTSTAVCKADEMIVSAVCIGRGRRSTSAQIDPEEKSARCVRSTLYLVCGKTTVFAGETPVNAP